MPRVPIERMKTPGSRKSESRMRSPRSAPFEKGSGVDRDDPDRQLGAADVADEALIRLDFPTPGGPVMPSAYACPVSG